MFIKFMECVKSKNILLFVEVMKNVLVRAISRLLHFVQYRAHFATRRAGFAMILDVQRGRETLRLGGQRMLAERGNEVRNLPEYGQNNLWFRYEKTGAVIVFVHGIFSSSRTCWLHSGRAPLIKPSFWPQIVADDERFDNLGIFLGGYYTDLDAGNYGIKDCVEELLLGLRQRSATCSAPIERDRIIFVCHSMGGVVVRSLLERHSQIFKDKDVALILIASPSYGSHVVGTLSALIDLSQNRQAMTLKWNSAIIGDLDDRFKDLKEAGFIRKLRGIEFYENRFILKSRIVPIFSRYLVVQRDSAGRYFGSPKQIPRSDHFSICKPRSSADIIHQYLCNFLSEEMFIPVTK